MDVASVALEKAGGDEAIVRLGVPEKDVISFGHYHPEVVVAALVLGQHQDTGGVDADPPRIGSRVFPHRLDHPVEQRNRALDKAAERRARQVQPWRRKIFSWRCNGK